MENTGFTEAGCLYGPLCQGRTRALTDRGTRQGATAKCQGKGQTSWTASARFWTRKGLPLGAQGVGWKRIAAEMGVGAGTIYRVALESSKTRKKNSGTAA